MKLRSLRNLASRASILPWLEEEMSSVDKRQLKSRFNLLINRLQARYLRCKVLVEAHLGDQELIRPYVFVALLLALAALSPNGKAERAIKFIGRGFYCGIWGYFGAFIL